MLSALAHGRAPGPPRWHSARHGAQRTVYQLDTVEWLRGGAAVELPGRFNVVTSLPDVSELRRCATVAEYEDWFVEVTQRVLLKTPPENVAIFYQTPGRFAGEGGAWLDKGHLCQLGARAAGAACVWQKVVLDGPAGVRRGGGRPGFVQMLCFSRAHRVPHGHTTVDVLPERGHCSWPRAMGEAACVAAVDYCREHVGADALVDPFCGRGSLLAVANARGLPAIGMDISERCCERASEHTARGAGLRSVDEV